MAFGSTAMHSGKSWCMVQRIPANYDAFWEKVLNSIIRPTSERFVWDVFLIWYAYEWEYSFLLNWQDSGELVLRRNERAAKKCPGNGT